MKTSTDIEKAMADVLNFASLEQKERLHGALDAVLKYSPGQARDDHGRFATGGGGGVGGSAPDTGGGGGISGGSSPSSGLSTLSKIPKKVTEEDAKKITQASSKVLEAAKLHPYVSDHYSDSSLGGLNVRSSNARNWTVIDGDNPSKTALQSVPKGHIEVGVAVWGKKLGVSYRPMYRDGEEYGYEPSKADMDRIALKINSSMKKAGANVVSVNSAGFDSGAGTKNINYAVLIKK